MKNSLSLFAALLLIPVHASFGSDNEMRDDDIHSSSSSLAGKSRARSPHSIDRETSGPPSKKRHLDDGGSSLDEFKQTCAEDEEFFVFDVGQGNSQFIA